MLVYCIYNAALLLLTPLLGLYLLWRRFVQGKERGALRQRLGFYDLPKIAARSDRTVIWLHAASVGEVVAASPLVKTLKEELNCFLVVSTVTASGQATARKFCLLADEVVYLPFDMPWFVRRALKALDPAALILMESELWFNLIYFAKRRGVSVMLANGRISDRTESRGKIIKWYFKELYRYLDLLGMQSELDALRAVTFGVPRDRVKVLGNTKFEEPQIEFTAEKVRDLRAELGFAPNDKIIVAGSTRAGEEAKVLEGFKVLSACVEQTRLLIAPRHLNRVPEIISLLKSEGYEPVLRTQRGAIKIARANQVMLLDTLGELTRVYAVAVIAFLGGSLVDVGGQNVLQPLAHGVPVLCGPHTYNFRSIVELATAAKVCYVVQNSKELGELAAKLMQDENFLASFPARARAFLKDNQGASHRTVELLAQLIVKPNVSKIA